MFKRRLLDLSPLGPYIVVINFILWVLFTERRVIRQFNLIILLKHAIIIIYIFFIDI